MSTQDVIKKKFPNPAEFAINKFLQLTAYLPSAYGSQWRRKKSRPHGPIGRAGGWV